MDLSIIVTSYKSPAILKICLNSIINSLENKKIDYELIVLDSESDETTIDMMEEDFPNIKFIPHEDNTGTSKLWNEGIRLADGKYIGIFNSDMIFQDDSIQKMLEKIKSDNKIGLLGPALLDFDGSTQFSCYGAFYSPWLILCRRTFLGKTFLGKKSVNKFLMKDWDHKETRGVHWVMGSAMMTSAEAIKKIGLLDERFFMYFEDVDWCRRAWESGLRVVYYPEAKIYHYHGKGSAKKAWFWAPFVDYLAKAHIKSGLIYLWKYKFKREPRIIS